MLKAAAVLFVFLVLAWECCRAFGEGEAEGAPGDYRFAKPPQPLESLSGIHPRLHADAARFEELRKLVAEDPVYGRMFETVRRKADKGVESGPPAYRAPRPGDDEQLWQREVGNMMPHLAFAYRMTGERRYLDSARDWMLASCGYETWGSGLYTVGDLAAGHQLYGLACAYDWLHGDLEEETRRAVRECFTRRAGTVLDTLLNDRIYWVKYYIQNHLWVSLTGLSAAGFATYGELEEAEAWINAPRAWFGRSYASLGADGASHEGVGYWNYGAEYLMKYTDLADGLLGEDHFEGHEWFRNTPYFRLYASLPRSAWTRSNCTMTYADSPRYDWYGPDYLLRKLAGEYGDGYAQWLADELEAAGVCADVAAWLNILWYDPTVKPVGPDGLPTFRHFDDMDLVYMRTDWSGGETLCSFKCGPPIGHHALGMYDEFDPGGGHNHPDAGAFMVFSRGDWLIVDDGYNWKTTEYQNTLLVNGIGQEGEGRPWFQGASICRSKRAARILATRSTPEFDYVLGDAAEAYKTEAGLTSFLRHFYYLKPSTWIIVDEVEAQKPSTFQFFYHGEYPFEEAGAGMYETRGPHSVLSLQVLTPASASLEAFKQELKSTGGSIQERKLNALKVGNAEPVARAAFITVLNARDIDGAQRAEAAMLDEKDGRYLMVRTPERSWRFLVDLRREGRPAPALLLAP